MVVGGVVVVLGRVVVAPGTVVVVNEEVVVVEECADDAETGSPAMLIARSAPATAASVAGRRKVAARESITAAQ